MVAAVAFAGVAGQLGVASRGWRCFAIGFGCVVVVDVPTVLVFVVPLAVVDRAVPVEFDVLVVPGTEAVVLVMG